MVLDILLFFSSIVILYQAFIAKALMDLSGADKFTDKDYIKNRTYTSDNKWSLPYEKGTKVWYYLWLYKPRWKERFPYSSTALSFVTDYWHHKQFIFLNLSFIGNLLLYTSIDNLLKFSNLTDNYIVKILFCFILIRLVYLISFNITYSKYDNG